MTSLIPFKTIKKRYKIAIVLTSFLLLVVILIGFVVYNATFQTFVVKKYLNYLAAELKTTITVKKVDVSFFNNIRIEKLYVEDLNNDTLFYADKIDVKIGLFSLENKKISISEATLQKPYFNLQHQKNEEHNNLFFITNYFATEDTTTSAWEFEINTINLIKGQFIYDDFNYEPLLAGVDFDHTKITYLTTTLNDIALLSDGVACNIAQLKFYEKSGFQVDNLRTQLKISNKGIETTNLHLQTPNSNITGNIIFETDSFSNLANFVTEVKMNTHFDSSLVSFRDVCFFADALNCLDKSVTLNGNITGTIANMKGRKLEITTDDGTYFKGNADVSGLPNLDDLFLYITIKELNTTKEKLEQIPLYPFVKENFIELPNNMKTLGNINFKGTLTGFTHDFVVYGTLKTDLGSINTDVSLKFKEDNTYYAGNVKTKAFQLGKFLGISDQISTIALNSKIVGKGFAVEDIDTKLTGEIQKIVIRGYNYEHIKVDGDFKNQVFSGKLDVADENITFNFDGLVDLSEKIPQFKFTANIQEAKLAKLNLVKTKEKMQTRFSTLLSVDLSGNSIDNIIGIVEFLDSKYVDKIDSIYVPFTRLFSEQENNQKKLSIDADFATVKIEGDYQIADFVAVVNNLLYNYLPSQNKEKYITKNITNNFKFEAILFHSEILTKLFFNGIKLSPNTQIDGYFNSEQNNLTLDAYADEIDAYGTIIKNFNLHGNADNKSLNVNTKIDEVFILGIDSLHLKDVALNNEIKNDTIFSSIEWNNFKDNFDQPSGVIENIVYFKPLEIESKFFNSFVVLNDSVWKIADENSMKIDSSSIEIKNFKFFSNEQKLLVDGKIDESDANNQLDVYFEKFNLNLFKKLIPKEVVNLEGIFNGVASIKKVNTDYLLTSDLSINNLKVNDYLIGEGNIKSFWNSDQEFLTLDSKFYIDKNPSILLAGKYYPKKELDNIDFNLTLNQTELSIIDTYINDFITNLKGKANATIAIKGSVNKPELKGNINLISTRFTIDYLKTNYHANSIAIKVLPDMIYFNGAVLTDEKKGSAVFNGTMLHNNFKEINFDLGGKFNEFMVLNTKKTDNEDYYGKAYASGFIDLMYNQPTAMTTIEMDLKTNKGTTFNIPLEGGEEVVENSFVTFVTKDTSIIIQQEKKLDLSKIDMRFALEVTDEAEVRLIFDEAIGDIMRSTGNGNLKLEINSAGDFNIFGDYTVKSGDYLFTLENIVNKRFNLLEGGIIKWNGNPLEADIDISAVYRTRTRLYDLLLGVDTSDVLKKRIPVDLTLRMQNSILTPDISFDISLPTADEDTKSKVKSILYVSNQEENIQELNKQVFSLLVLNRFLPPPGVEGVAGNAGLEKTAGSELLSNQVSNWLSKISNEFDIGLNYRPGDEISSQEVELALSTQLFNDRLIIDSNFGLSDRQNSPSGQGNNNLIGDVSIEYKVSKDGKLRVRAFNKSNQFSLTEINSPYTQGVGLSYKEEFDTFGEFFRSFFSLFKRKTKKQKGVAEKEME